MTDIKKFLLLFAGLILGKLCIPMVEDPFLFDVLDWGFFVFEFFAVGTILFITSESSMRLINGPETDPRDEEAINKVIFRQKWRKFKKSFLSPKNNNTIE